MSREFPRMVYGSSVTNMLRFHRLAMGNVRTPSFRKISAYKSTCYPRASRYSRLLTYLGILDPFPYRSDNHNRPPKDAPLLRTQTETQRHGSLLRRSRSYPSALDPYRVPCRAIRYHGPLRRLPRYDCRLRAECARRRTLYRDGCR